MITLERSFIRPDAPILTGRRGGKLNSGQ